MQAMGLQGYARIHCTCIQVNYPIIDVFVACLWRVCGVFVACLWLRHNFPHFSRSSPVPPEEVRFQLAAVPEFFFESIAEFVLFCSRLVQYSHACTRVSSRILSLGGKFEKKLRASVKRLRPRPLPVTTPPILFVVGAY